MPADPTAFLDATYHPSGTRMQLMLGWPAPPHLLAAATAAVLAHGLVPGRRVARMHPRPGERMLRADDMLEFFALYGHEYQTAVFSDDCGLDMPSLAAAAHAAGCEIAFFPPGAPPASSSAAKAPDAATPAPAPAPAEPASAEPAPAEPAPAQPHTTSSLPPEQVEHAVRVVVSRVDHSRTGTRVGDYFDVIRSTIVMPPGTGFNVYAMNAVFTVIGERLRAPSGDDWLSRKPYISSADPEENIVMRLDRIPLADIHYLDTTTLRGDR